MAPLDNAFSNTLSGKRRIIPSPRGARMAFVALIPVIAVAAVYGRTLERSYPSLIYILPNFGFLLLLLHATALAILCARIPKGIAETSRKAILVAAALATPFFILLLSLYLIELPIERIHILKYGLLAYLVAFALSPRDGERRIARAFVIAAVVGVAEETVQIWIPDRRFDSRDILLNVLSAATGTWYASVVNATDRILRGLTPPSLRDSSR